MKSQSFIHVQTKKINLKMSPGKCRPFCIGLNVFSCGFQRFLIPHWIILRLERCVEASCVVSVYIWNYSKIISGTASVVCWTRAAVEAQYNHPLLALIQLQRNGCLSSVEEYLHFKIRINYSSSFFISKWSYLIICWYITCTNHTYHV